MPSGCVKIAFENGPLYYSLSFPMKSGDHYSEFSHYGLIIVAFPIYSEFSHSYVTLPEGKHDKSL